MVERWIMEQRNQARKMLEPTNRGPSNAIRIGQNETREHRLAKVLMCMDLIDKGKEFYTEAVFIKPWRGRADIVVLDDCEIVEILHTETIEQFNAKTNEYPTTFFEVRAVEAKTILNDWGSRLVALCLTVPVPDPQK